MLHSVSAAAARRLSRRALALAITAACAGPLQAADTPQVAPQSRAAGAPPTELPGVQVHATAFPANAVDDIDVARKRLDERAGGTTLVDGESYRDRRVGNLADALGMAAGIFVQPRFGAEEARLSIRGSALQRTFHGRGIAVLQDGVPLNLADGSFDFQAIEPLAARYVEVWRGANALEHGAAMLGGAIDFVSRTGYDASPLLLRVDAGSYGTRRAQAAIAASGARADAYLTATSARQHGFRAHSEQENERLFGNAGIRFGDDLDGRLYLTHVDTRSQLPGNLTLSEALRDPRLAAPDSIALDQRRDFHLDRIAGKLAWATQSGGALTLSLSHSAKRLHHPIFQVLDQVSRDDGIDVHWRSEGALGRHRSVLSAGLSHAQVTLDDRRHANVGGVAGAATNHFDQRATNTSAWIEDQLSLAPRWMLVLGTQALHATRRSRDLLVTAGRDESFDVASSAASPRLGVRYDGTRGLQLFANASRSAEPPSFGELSGGAGVTPVSSQRAASFEVGMRVQRTGLDIDAAIYRARIHGELLALSDAEGNPLGTLNAGRTIHAGIEFAARWRASRAWTLSANYLGNAFRFDRDPIYGDDAIAGLPSQQLRAGLRWSRGGFHLEPNIEWVPEGAWIDHANSMRAPGYTLLGLRAGGAIGGAGWTWFADLRNLGDRRWIASTNVVADARGLDGRNYLPGEGRSFFVGVEFTP